MWLRKEMGVGPRRVPGMWGGDREGERRGGGGQKEGEECLGAKKLTAQQNMAKGAANS